MNGLNGGKAMFWGQVLEEEEEKEQEEEESVEETDEEKKEAGGKEAEDAAVRSLQSFGIFDAQDNLKVVLAKVVKRVFAETDAVARKNDNEGLFDPYFHAQSSVEPGKHYYPYRVRKEHTGFFVKEQEAAAQADQLEQRRKHDRTLNCRVEDELSYAFDRKQPAGRRSGLGPGSGTGSGTGSGSGRPKDATIKKWVSNMSSSEDEKIKADFAARVHEHGRPYAKAARHRLDWVNKGRRKRDHALKRLEHLLAYLQEEQQKDMQREMLLFESCVQNQKGQKDARAQAEASAVEEEARRKHQQVTWRVAQERTEVADKVMRLLQDYRLISGAEMALYLKGANDFFEAQLRSRGPPSVAAAAFANMTPSSSTSTRRPATTIGIVRRHRNPSQRARTSKGGQRPPRVHEPKVGAGARSRPSTVAAGSSGRHGPALSRSKKVTTALPWSQGSAREALERRRRESEAAMATVSELRAPLVAAAHDGVTTTVGPQLPKLANMANCGTPHVRARTAALARGRRAQNTRRPGSRAAGRLGRGRLARVSTAGRSGDTEVDAGLAPAQWGGWGSKLSAEAERILHSSKGRQDAAPAPASALSKQTLGLRVDKMDTSVEHYSHLLMRAVTKPGSEQQQRRRGAC